VPEPAQVAPQVSPNGAQPGVFVDPYRAYSFKLLIQNIVEGHFTECRGMGAEVEVIRYREGGTSPVVHHIPGPVRYREVTLCYGLTSSREVWDWFTTAVQGKVQRKNVSILMLDSDGVTEVVRWNLFNAWIASWHGAPLNALSDQLAIECVTLVYDSLQRG
jgi:phage tail-like protein